MQLTAETTVAVTGATGLVGSHVTQSLRERGIPVRALVRESTDCELLKSWGATITHGDLSEATRLAEFVDGAAVIVHCAAKVGDWGPVEAYREVNVAGTRRLTEASLASGALHKFVHISSLGVYPTKDHYGTDESTPPAASGIDGYTRTKVEAEQLIQEFVAQHRLPAIILRPGFVYGPRDRTVMPRLLERLRANKFKYLGTTDKLMNNTFVGNLCHGITLAIEQGGVTGQAFNIRDPRAVTKREFIETIASAAECPLPKGVVPMPVARALAGGFEAIWRLLGRSQAPLVSQARLKFLGLNLDYSIDRARYELGYEPTIDFSQAMPETVRSFL